MKFRSRRLMVLLLSAAMVVPAAPGAYAEETQAAQEASADAQAEAPAETQPQTQAETQPQTQAPTEQPQTQAPTEQPQTQAPTEQPQTQAPTEQPQTQAPAEPQTQGHTEAQTQTATEARQTENAQGSESETDTEKSKTSFEAKASKVTVTVTLPKKDALPEGTKAVLKTAPARDDSRILEALEEGQKVVSGGETLTVSLTDKEGKALELPKGTKLSFSFDGGLDMDLRERGRGEIHFLGIGDKAAEADASLKESQDGLLLQEAKVTLPADAKSVTYAAAGLEDRGNAGGKADRADLEDLAGASAYAVVAGSYDGPKKKLDILTADDEDKDKSGKAEDLLDSLSEYSVTLADAESADDVTVVNLYADDKGKVDTASEKVTDPLHGIADEDVSIDVTDGYVVVNIIAPKADTALEIPKFTVTYTEDGKAEKVTSKEHAEYGGHLVVNLAAANGKSGSSYGFAAYTGSADLDDSAVGVYLAPDASLSLDGDLVGAAYAVDTVVGGKFTASTTAASGEDEPEKKDTESPDKSGEAGETATESADGNANPLQKQTDLGTAGQKEDSFAGGLAALAAPDDGETAAEVNADQADVAASAYQGTISVDVRKTDKDLGEFKDVSLTLYREDGKETAGALYSWVSGEKAVELPKEVTSGLTEGTYQLRQSALPVSDGVTYQAAQAIVFAISAAGVLTYTGNAASYKDEKEVKFVFQNRQTDPGQLQAGIPVTFGVGYLNATDQAPAYLAGAKITISETSTEDSQTSTTGTVLSAFTMPAAQTAVDFGQWLPEEDAAAPANGRTAVFKVTESSPSAGYYLVKDTERTLTFTYSDGTAEGSAKGWKLTANSAVTADDAAADAAKLAAVTFRDAPGVHISSSLVSYGDSPKEIKKLTGGTFSLSLDGKELAADDYQVCSYDKSTGAYVLSEDTSLKIPDTEKQDLVAVIRKAGKTLTVTGKDQAAADKDKYHYTLASPEADLGKPSQDGYYEAVLTSRAAANITVTSVQDDGAPNAGITVSVLGTEQTLTGSSTTYSFNSAAADAAVGALLKTSAGETTSAVYGIKNNDGFEFTPSSLAVVDKPPVSNEDGTASISVKLTSEPLENFVNANITVRMETWRSASPKAVIQRLAKEKTYTVGLFEDADGTVSAADPQTIRISKNNYSSGTAGSVKFTVPVNVKTGSTYYVFVLDKNGKPVKDSADVKTVGNGVAVSLKASPLNETTNTGSSQTRYAVTSKLVKLRTVYSAKYVAAHPDEFTGSGSFDIELRVVDAAGREQKVDNMVAEFRVRSGDGKLALKNNQKITLKEASAGKKEGISFPVSGTDREMSVTLMSIKTSAGASLAGDYTLLTASYDNKFSKAGDKTGERNFTLAIDKENQGPVVFVLRKNDTNEKASLTLTKSVMYKKTPIRVNATYYIGIFADKAHKKLLFKKAMTLRDASSVSDTLKVNVNSQKDRQITLYFAETDRSGKVVKSGKKTGYNISVNPESVTLAAPTSSNPDGNMNATVTVTNEVLDGTRTAQRLTDPTSGFAGDSAALADAQSLAASGNLNNRTGDTNPLGRYLIMLVLAGAAICAAVIVLVVRSRKKKQ